MSSVRQQGRFVNAAPRLHSKPASLWRVLKRYLFESRQDATPTAPLPIETLTPAQLQALPRNGIYLARLGHSSLLLKIQGDYWLIDPVFSLRASPLQWLGPKRFHAPPISLEQLPALKGVLLSHNHYDHLDKPTIRAIRHRVERFYVPLGVGADLADCGVDAEQVVEFDWWQERVVDKLTLVATPAQHFSGRGLKDANRSLWCSWVLQSGDQRLFFSGDSGYFDGFKAIGEKYGPFDLTLIESGAYDAMWPDVHMQPEQSLQAHIDLGGKQLMPIHNGTFDLAFHAWYHPLQSLSRLAHTHGVTLVTPLMGQLIPVGEPVATHAWWRHSWRQAPRKDAEQVDAVPHQTS